MNKPHYCPIRLGATSPSEQRRTSRPWSSEEYETLRRAYEIGGAKEAFEALGGTRTLTAIKQRASQLALPKQHWTEDEKSKVRRLIVEGRSLQEISKQVGRSPSAIRQKIRAMAFEEKAAVQRPAPYRKDRSKQSTETQVLSTKPAKPAKRLPYTRERVTKTLSEAGAEFLDGDVVTGSSPVRARCRCGETVTKPAQAWIITPDGCIACRGQKGSESKAWARLAYAANLAKAHGVDDLPPQASPKTMADRLLWACELNHTWEASLSMIANGHWCPECARPLIVEGMVRSVVEGVFGKPFQKARPAFLDGLELDGFNEELCLAFEYDGEFHQAEKQQERDRRKRHLCELNGVQLIEVDHHDGALGPSGIQRAVERELLRLKIRAERSPWEVPVHISGGSAQHTHRKKFEEALAARGFTWDPNQWVDAHTKVLVRPPEGGPPVPAIPRTFTAGRVPAKLAANAKLDSATIEDRVTRAGWALTNAADYQNSHSKLDFIDPQGRPRRMTWNKWQGRVERRVARKTGAQQLSFEFSP